MTSLPPASAVTTAAAVPEGRDLSKQGGLRLAIIGENAEELGLRIAEQYGLVATSMDELMEGRKGRKTDNVKAKAVSVWLTERGGAKTGEKRKRVTAGTRKVVRAPVFRKCVI